MKTGTVSVFLKNKTFINWPLRFWWFPPQTQVLQCVVKVFVNLFCFFSRLKVWEIFSDLLYKLIQNLNCHLQNIKQKSSTPAVYKCTDIRFDRLVFKLFLFGQSFKMLKRLYADKLLGTAFSGSAQDPSNFTVLWKHPHPSKGEKLVISRQLCNYSNFPVYSIQI